MPTSVQNNIDALISDFGLFDDWEGRYRYLIDLGRSLPPMEDALKTDETLVRGCTSRVWMVAHTDAQGRLHFIADSDAHIVRGLIGLLMRIYQGQPAQDLAGLDIRGVFESIGLDQNLSPNRRNGFFSMVEKLHAVCEPVTG